MFNITSWSRLNSIYSTIPSRCSSNHDPVWIAVFPCPDLIVLRHPHNFVAVDPIIGFAMTIGFATTSFWILSKGQSAKEGGWPNV
jgi:hypothetical protein